MVLRYRLFLTFVTSILLVSQLFSSPAQLTDREREWLSRAKRFEQEGWIFLHLEGGPYERGFQHGYFLSAEIEKGQRILRHLIHWETPKDWEFFVEAGKKLFHDKLDTEIKEELKPQDKLDAPDEKIQGPDRCGACQADAR